MINLSGATIDEIERDIKTGDIVLKSHGDIKGTLHAKTVIIYGNVSGDIHAEEVLILGGKATGKIIANTVAGIEYKEKQKEEKRCQTCKYFHLMNNLYDGTWICIAADATKRRINFKTCENYKEKNPAEDMIKYKEEQEKEKKQQQKKTCQTCKYYKQLSKYQHFYSCECDNTLKEIKCEKYQKKENPAQNVSSPHLPIKYTY